MKTTGYVLLCLLLAVAARAADAPGGMTASAEHKPVTLAECYTQTLEHNLDIRRQRAGVEQAAGVKTVFTARALPRASMSGTAGYSGGTLYGPGGPFAVLQTEASQPIFDMGIPASLRRGRLEVIIAQQTLNRAVTEQLHATRLAFLRSLAARRLFEDRRVRLRRGRETDALMADLCAVNYSLTSKNEILLEPKEEVKRRIGRSPDAGDALVISLAGFLRPSPARIAPRFESGAARAQYFA